MEFSYWERSQLIGTCEFVVVGGGIVGMFTALELSKKVPADSILIIEKNAFGGGGSTRNAGFACFGSPTELIADISSMGKAQTLELLKLRFQGLQKLINTLGAKNIDYQKCGGMELFRFRDGKKVPNESEIQSLNALIAEATNKENCFEDSTSEALKMGLQVDHAWNNTLEGAINTGKMFQTLEALVREKGIRKANGVQLNSFEKMHDGYELRTSEGTLQANRLLLCTNGLSRKLIPSIEVHPSRNLVMISKPYENLPIQGTFHMNEGFLYFRNVENRLLIGGGRHWDPETENTAAHEINELIKNNLQELTKQLLPSHDFEWDHMWTGILGVGRSKSPIIQQVDERLFCAVRMGGMGVAIGSQVGTRLGQLVLNT